MSRRLLTQAACMASVQRGLGSFFDALERPGPATRALSANAARLRQHEEKERCG